MTNQPLNTMPMLLANSVTDPMKSANYHFLKESLVGEEWMALRQIAFGGEAVAIPQSVRLRLLDLGLVARDHYGRLTLTETGRRMIETPH